MAKDDDEHGKERGPRRPPPELRIAEPAPIAEPGKRTQVQVTPQVARAPQVAHPIEPAREAALPSAVAAQTPELRGLFEHRGAFWQAVERAYPGGTASALDPFTLRTASQSDAGRPADPRAQPAGAPPSAEHDDTVPLAQTAARSVARTGAPIERPLALEAPAFPPSYATTPDAYLVEHRQSFIEALRQALRGRPLPPPHDGRLGWVTESAAIDAIADEISRHVETAPLPRVAALAPRGDVRAVVEWGRSAPGTAWEAAIGALIADELITPIHASIPRMGLQVWSGIQLGRGTPTAGQLSAESALDRVVGNALVRPGVVTIAGSKTPGAANSRAVAPRANRITLATSSTTSTANTGGAPADTHDAGGDHASNGAFGLGTTDTAQPAPAVSAAPLLAASPAPGSSAAASAPLLGTSAAPASSSAAPGPATGASPAPATSAPAASQLGGPREALNAKMDRQLAAATRAGAPITATGYAHLHLAEILRAAHLFLVDREVPSGDPQVTLGGDFYDHLFAPFANGDTAAGVTRLRTWLAPEDLLAMIDRNRALFEHETEAANAPGAALDYGSGSKGPARSSPSVGMAIGSALEARLRESLARMSPRLVAATAKHRQAGKAAGREPAPVEPKDLVTSHKLDWAVANAMVGHGTPGVTVKPGTLAVRDDITTTYRVVHKVEWQTGVSAVRAIDPPDATVEEIATYVFKTPTEAYRIRRVGDLFLIPAGSDVAKGANQTEVDATRLAFGQSAAQVETAEVERAMKNDVEAKAPEGVSFATLTAAWSRVNEQLVGLALVVREFGLEAHLVAAAERHKAHKLDLAALSGRDAIVRAELFARQETLLASIAADVGAMVTDAHKRAASATSSKAGAKASAPGTAQASTDATRNALLKLVAAAGLAHLPETGAALYAEAHASRRDMMLETFEAMLGDVSTQLAITRLTVANTSVRSSSSEGVFKTSMQGRADALGARVAALRSRLLSGTATGEEIEAIYAAIEALRFEAGVIANIGQLGEAFDTIENLQSSGWVMFSEWFTNTNVVDIAQGKDPDRLSTTRRAAEQLRIGLHQTHARWLNVQRQAVALSDQLLAGGVTDPHDKALALVQPQLVGIRMDLAKIGGEPAIREFLTEAYDTVKSAERRAMILKITTLIGIGVLSGGVGDMAAAAAGSIMGPGLGATIIGVAVEATVFTSLDAALSGHVTVGAFISNFVGNLATFGALRGVSKGLSGTAIGKTLAKAAAGERVALLSRLAASAGAITASTLVAVGVQFAQAEYESLRTTGKTMSFDELKMAGVQGMAMMIGAAISHKLLSETSDQLKALGMRAGGWVARRNQIKKLSKEVMSTGDPGTTMELLNEAREALTAKGDDIAALGEQTDAQLKERGLSRPVVEAMAKNQKADVQALDNLEAGTMAAQLGLDTVVPGQVYAGDAAAIARVTANYRARPGYRVEQEGTGHRVIAPNGESFHVLERADGVRSEADAKQSAGQRTTPSPQEEASAPTNGPPAQGDSTSIGSAVPTSSNRQNENPQGSERSSQDTKRRTLTDVDPSNDVARIQTKALNAAIEEGAIKLDWGKKNSSGTKTLGQEYKKWIESPAPVDFSGREPKANYHGDPEFAGEIAAIVKKGNVTLNLRAQTNADAAAQLELKSLDPASATYPADRAKLVERFGPEAVGRYEQATLGGRSDPARHKIFEQVDNVVGPQAIDRLRNAFPGYEIYITGSASQPSKGGPADLATIADLDVMIVVPESVDATGRAAIEAQAKAMSVPTTPEFADATGRKSLPIDATARTKTQAFGVMTTATPKDPATGKSRTPLEYARVDANVAENTGEVRATADARQSHDAQSSSVGRAKPTEAEAARKAAIEKYKDLTAADFTGVDDPRLREIHEAAREENREVAARLRIALENAGVKDFEIQFRAKSLSSMLGKLQETPGMRIQDIKDLSGVRVNITRVNEANFAQYDRIKAAIQREFGMPEAAVKDYNKKPNPWGYTGRVHMFEIGGAEIYSEIQVGSRDLSEFIEKKFLMKGGKTIELHDLTGYKGQLYGKSIPPELQSEYTRIFGLITEVNKGGSNLADVPKAKAEVDAYFARVQAFLDAP